VQLRKEVCGALAVSSDGRQVGFALADGKPVIESLDKFLGD
jgi:hypothetical protein